MYGRGGGRARRAPYNTRLLKLYVLQNMCAG